jgi:endoglucanase
MHHARPLRNRVCFLSASPRITLPQQKSSGIANLIFRKINLLILLAFVMFSGFSNQAFAALSMLHANGRQIVDANGNTVQLKGVNLGGWFIMEKWMCPLDSGSLPDTYSVIQELDSRFGVATEQSLIAGYQKNWITTSDLANIKSAGFNTVRVPVWWGQFYPINNISNSGWRADAFTELDWLVNAAAAQGLYVIIDMHGAVGGQSTSDDTGQANQNAYWSNGNNQGNTAYMWWQIANHYNGNPTVAGYDLLNEPTGAPNNAAVISAYASLYSSVRSADANHMIFIEGTWGNWNWSMLPSPSSEGWTNVVYEMHEYQYNASEATVEQGSSNQVNDFNNHSSYNVPGYIGEWNDFQYGSGAWQFSVNAYNNGGESWTFWAYKATSGLNPNGWGLYDPSYWATTPNISTDSASTIASDWAQWTTANSFSLNTSLGFN